MRSDMWKVIVERPRWGHRFARHVGRRDRKLARGDVEGDALPRMSRMKRRYDKQLNENLAPLERYLRSQVGRRWDDVYSDIRAHIRFDNVVQKHVCQHLKDFVALHVRLADDGSILNASRSAWFTTALYVDDLYVCPSTGELRVVEPRVRRIKNVFIVSDVEHAQRVGRHWDRVTISSLSPGWRTSKAVDVVVGRPLALCSERELIEAHGRPGVFASARARYDGWTVRQLRRRGLLPSV